MIFKHKDGSATVEATLLVCTILFLYVTCFRMFFLMLNSGIRYSEAAVCAAKTDCGIEETIEEIRRWQWLEQR